MKDLCYHAADVSYPISRELPGLLESARQAAQKVTKVCEHKTIVLIGTGTSGAMAMVAMAHALIPLGHTVETILLRKENESCHRRGHEQSTSYLKNACGVFIVDDFVSTGRTLYRILTETKKIVCEECDEHGAPVFLGKNLTGLICLSGGSQKLSIIQEIFQQTSCEAQYFIHNN